MQTLNELAHVVHAENRHWWHDPATGEPIEVNHGEKLMLMVSELAEAMEGERRDLMDDHLPHRKMAEVELADFAIRALDYAGRLSLDLDGVYYVAQRGFEEPSGNRAEMLFQIVRYVVDACGPIQSLQGQPHRTAYFLCSAIFLAERYAHHFGYDLMSAMTEKRAYNKSRADHKAEARLAANGKKF